MVYYVIISKVAVFPKPLLPAFSKMTRGQTNEMLWAVRHLLPQKEVIKKSSTQKDMRGKIKPSFWVRYTKATRGIDKRAEVFPLSRCSPGGLQKMWEETIGPNSLKLAKEVHSMNIGEKKLLDVRTANMEDERIPSSSAPPTQSPPAS